MFSVYNNHSLFGNKKEKTFMQKGSTRTQAGGKLLTDEEKNFCRELFIVIMQSKTTEEFYRSIFDGKNARLKLYAEDLVKEFKREIVQNVYSEDYCNEAVEFIGKENLQYFAVLFELYDYLVKLKSVMSPVELWTIFNSFYKKGKEFGRMEGGDLFKTVYKVVMLWHSLCEKDLVFTMLVFKNIITTKKEKPAGVTQEDTQEEHLDRLVEGFRLEDLCRVLYKEALPRVMVCLAIERAKLVSLDLSGASDVKNFLADVLEFITVLTEVFQKSRELSKPNTTVSFMFEKEGSPSKKRDPTRDNNPKPAAMQTVSTSTPVNNELCRKLFVTIALSESPDEFANIIWESCSSAKSEESEEYAIHTFGGYAKKLVEDFKQIVRDCCGDDDIIYDRVITFMRKENLYYFAVLFSLYDYASKLFDYSKQFIKNNEELCALLDCIEFLTLLDCIDFKKKSYNAVDTIRIVFDIVWLLHKQYSLCKKDFVFTMLGFNSIIITTKESYLAKLIRAFDGPVLENFLTHVLYDEKERYKIAIMIFDLDYYAKNYESFVVSVASDVNKLLKDVFKFINSLTNVIVDLRELTPQQLQSRAEKSPKLQSYLFGPSVDEKKYPFLIKESLTEPENTASLQGTSK